MEKEMRRLRDVLMEKIDIQKEYLDDAQDAYNINPSELTSTQLSLAENNLQTLYEVLTQMRTIVTGSSNGEWPKEWDVPENSERIKILARYPEALAIKDEIYGWSVWTSPNACAAIGRGPDEDSAWQNAYAFLTDRKLI